MSLALNARRRPSGEMRGRSTARTCGAVSSKITGRDAAGFGRSAAAARNTAATVIAPSASQAMRSRDFRRAATGAATYYDPPSRIRWSWSFASCAVWIRSSGSFARHLTSRSSAGGFIGASCEIGAGSLDMIAEMSEAWLFPSKARLPSPSRRARSPTPRCRCGRPPAPRAAPEPCTGTCRRSSPPR